jgi:hypothetical protein
MKIFELGVRFGYLLIDISLACAVGGEGIFGCKSFWFVLVFSSRMLSYQSCCGLTICRDHNVVYISGSGLKIASLVFSGLIFALLPLLNLYKY